MTKLFDFQSLAKEWCMFEDKRVGRAFTTVGMYLPLKLQRYTFRLVHPPCIFKFLIRR